MSNVPTDRKYTPEHEWLLLESENIALVGITDHAQSSLGDITYVELPQEDQHFAKGDTFGVVESVKAASDLYMPVSGKVISVNAALEGSPEVINDDPHGEGWMIRVELDDPSEVESLMDAEAYKAHIG